MENELLQVLSALSRIDVHGEESCKNMLFAISRHKESCIMLQQTAAPKAAEKEAANE